MINISDQIIKEFTEEEIATLMHFIDRHRRWKMKTDDGAISRQHRVVADSLKDTADTIQDLLELIKNKEIEHP